MFTYTGFKSIMDVPDITEETYAFVLRTVFKYVNTVHSIDIDNTDSSDISEDLQYAMFIHAKFIYETQIKNASVVSSAKDSAGNSVTYKTELPSIITSTYRMYSPLDPVVI